MVQNGSRKSKYRKSGTGKSEMRNLYFDFHITSPFDERINPITHEPEFHRGIDFVHPEKKVYAGLGGVVRLSTSGEREGNFLQIYNIIGGVMFYVNLFHNEKNLVQKGDMVNRNTYVAIMGKTGSATGVHVHLEIFSYKKTANYVKKIISSGDVKTHIPEKSSRIFFDPLDLFKYFEKRGVNY